MEIITRKLFCPLFFCLFVGFSCHAPSAPENVFLAFQKSLRKGQKNIAWTFLSHSSQQWFEKKAKQENYPSGQKLFEIGDFSSQEALRLHPQKKGKQSHQRYTLPLLSSVNQLVLLELIHEKQQWKIHWLPSS